MKLALKLLLAAAVNGAISWVCDVYLKSSIGTWRYIPAVLFGFVSGLLLAVAFCLATVLTHVRIQDPRTPEWVRKTAGIAYHAGLVLALVSQPIVLTYRIAGSHSANRFRDQLATILIYLLADIGIVQSLRDTLRRRRRARA